MLYGEEPHVMDRTYDAATLTTALALEAAAGVIYQRVMSNPGMVTRFGFRPTVLFDYATQTAKGVLTLYRYPLGVNTNKVALATINLENGDLAGVEYSVRVSNKPGDVSPTPAAPADYNAGDALVVEITTAATGGGGIAGDFQPFIEFQNRGESIGNQPMVVDRTP